MKNQGQCAMAEASRHYHRAINTVKTSLLLPAPRDGSSMHRLLQAGVASREKPQNICRAAEGCQEHVWPHSCNKPVCGVQQQHLYSFVL